MCDNYVYHFLVTACTDADIVVSMTDEDGDGNPEIIDPCSCDDPLNITENNVVDLFHDFVTVSGLAPGQTVELDVTSGALYDNQGNPLIPDGMGGRYVLPEIDMTGVYHLDFWTEPGVGFGGQIYINGLPYTGDGGTVMSVCNQCEFIPTIGQWGLIVLIISLLIVGIIAIRQFGNKSVFKFS